MASRTQLRLGQLTGSLGTGAGKIRPDAAAGTLASYAFNDLSGSLSAMLSGISRIHGRTGVNALNNDAGTFYTSILPTSDSINIGADNAEFGDIFISDAKALKLGADQDVTITHDNSTGADVVSAGAFDIQAGAATTINTTAGNLTVDAAAANLVLDGHTGVDIDASNTGAKVSIDGVGGIDIGTANDVAIDIDSAALDIDASGAITIDGTDSISIGANAAAGAINLGTNATARTISIGNVTGATELNLRAGSGNVDIGTAEGADAGRILLSGSHGADSVKVMSSATFDDDVTITGNLTVNGSQVKIDGETVVLDDSLMELATVNKAAPGSSTTAKDKGILLHHHNGSAASLNFMGFDSTNESGKFTFKTGVTDDGDGSISGGTVATVKANLEGISSQVTVTDSSANTAFPVVLHDESSALLDDTGTFTYNPSSALLKVSHIQVDSNAADLISVETSNLTIASAASAKIDAEEHIILDSKTGQVKFFDENVEFGVMSSSSDLGLTLSSSAGKDVALDSNSGFVSFNNGGPSATKGGAVYVGGANEIFFGIFNPEGADDDEKKAVPGNLILKKSAASVLSASSALVIDAGHDAASIRLLTANHDSNFVGLKAGTVSSPFTLTLPNAVASSVGQVLSVASITGPEATLEFSTPGANTTKGIKIISPADSPPIAVGSGLDFGSGLAQGQSPTNLLSTNEKLVDVFVNGQLMTSGSLAQVITDGSRDYRVTDDDTVAFGFELELDDIVTVIKRG